MNIIPEGEDIRKAVKWISEMRQDAPGRKISELVGEACLKFDLSPAEAETLMRLLQEKNQ
ncbi:MAG: hypothetical protein ACOZF0_03930 [Thermodesulfobacteriota bacterium]